MRSTLRLAVFLLVACFVSQSAWAYYNPSTGRWLSRDPMGEVGPTAPQPATASTLFLPRDAVGANHYAFVGNDPIGSVDPIGLWKFVPDLVVFDGLFGPSPVSPVASSFAMSAIPNRAEFQCRQCNEIRFVQIYRALKDITFPVRAGNEVDWSGNWVVDADIPPYYPWDPPWEDPKTGRPSSMNDTPQLPLNALQRVGGYIVQMEFETCAVCSKGGATGEVYGCVKWRHRLTSQGDRREFIARGTDVDWSSTFGTRRANDQLYQYRFRPWEARRATDIPILTTVGPASPTLNFRNQEGLNPTGNMATKLNRYFP